MDVLAVLDGYSLDKVLPCIANPEKIRVIVKIGRGYRPLLTTEYEQEKKRIVEALAE
jgi:hypothetical protein